MLWHPGIAKLPGVLQLLIFGVRFCFAVIRDVISGDFTLRAAGLVYITILSIVPVLAIVFSILKGFGVHRTLEPLLYNFLEPLGEKGAELTTQVIGFVDNVEGNLLAGASLLLLFFTTLSMAQRIEDSINFVWRVDRSRSVAQRITEYLSLVLVVPIVVVTAITMIASVRSTALMQRIEAFEAIGETILLISQLAPYGMLIMMFTLAYWFLPNTRVRFLSAFIGGIAGGLLWTSAGGLFTTFVVGSTRTNSIFASFAIVIMALIWIYVCWMILLIGALISFYVQNPEHLRLGYKQINIGGRTRERIAIGIMTRTAANFRDGSKQPTIAEIAESAELPSLMLLPVVNRLVAAGLLTRTSKNELFPSRDPGNILMSDVLAAIRNQTSVDIWSAGKWPRVVMSLSRRIEDALESEIGTVSVYALLDNDAAEDSVPQN